MQHTQPVGLRHISGPVDRYLTAAAEAALAEHEMRQRIDSYLVRSPHPKTVNLMAYVFDLPRYDVIRHLVALERAGKVTHSRAGWEATHVPQ